MLCQACSQGWCLPRAPRPFRMGLFTGHSSLITAATTAVAVRSGSLRKVGQTRRWRRFLPPSWDSTQLGTGKSRNLGTDQPKNSPSAVTFSLAVQWKRRDQTEWKTSSHPEMWERSVGYFFRLYLSLAEHVKLRGCGGRKKLLITFAQARSSNQE